MAGKVALLLASPTQPCPFSLPAQTLGLTGAQTTQLLVDPPWRPAVLWDRVTLTCQGSGTWYKDRKQWGQVRRNHLNVTESGIYTCDRPGSGRSPPVRVVDDELVLQLPACTLLEGDTVTLRCQGQWNSPVPRVRFYQDEKELTESLRGTELSLSPLQRHHSGRYCCEGFVRSWPSRSAAVTVTVPKLFSVLVLEGPPKLTVGSFLTLSCLSTPSPLRPQAALLHVFYQDGPVVGGQQGSPQLLVPAMGVSHSGNYSFQVRSEEGSLRKSSTQLHVTECSTGPHLELHQAGDNDSVTVSDPLNVTVLVPMANVTITPGPLSHQMRAGDNVTLCYSGCQEEPGKVEAAPDHPAPQEEMEVLYTNVTIPSLRQPAQSHQCCSTSPQPARSSQPAAIARPCQRPAVSLTHHTCTNTLSPQSLAVGETPDRTPNIPAGPSNSSPGL
ncbi:Fc receptor-like protein 4 [Zonotrichia leucophrys gambelii]|uniref:Fc receptor-like protein 4 n=1 Tax=Zonotrichia leucophrys gambelii TaxID=257770 RepID=UPI0031404562